MTLLIGAVTLGAILSLLAIAVYISFRIFDCADITVDGSLTLGASVTGVLLVKYGFNPWFSTTAGFFAGCIAGMITGILQTSFRINALLSGILVMTGLYSVNLRIMGKSNIPFLGAETFTTRAEALGQQLFIDSHFNLLGWMVPVSDFMTLMTIMIILLLISGLLWWFFLTDIGTAMRASGDNPQMIKALGGNVDRYRIFGLGLSNGLVGLSGSLWAQYQGFSDAQMGIGMVVWGLASVIIGEALTGISTVSFAIVGAILGSILFRELVAIALSFGLNPNDLKLVTAFFVFVALILPEALAHTSKRIGKWRTT
jgi:putative tryptophan/tyrosine transport system permease protein